MSCPSVLALVSLSLFSLLVPKWSFVFVSPSSYQVNTELTDSHTSIEAGLRGLSGAFIINQHPFASAPFPY
jgi:hypothetical protein